jgi:hypothetical protein
MGREICLGLNRSTLKNILPELKTVLPNADFVIEGYVDSIELLRDEGPFDCHTGNNPCEGEGFSNFKKVRRSGFKKPFCHTWLLDFRGIRCGFLQKTI